MKKILSLSLCLFLLQGWAIGQNKFQQIDDYVRSLDLGNQSLEAFTKGPLIAKSTTSVEKARAIYIWITENIAYDHRKYGNSARTVRIRYRTERELQQKMAELDRQQIRKTLKLRRGICGDYALLFNQMCNYAGIESRKVSGFVKIDYSQIGKLPKGSNHAWNSFKANGQWYLVDATWGAGYTNPEVTKFIKFYRDEYFMMPPSDMIKDHYPEEERWQLLSRPIGKQTFANQPIYHVNYWQLGMREIKPKVGRLSRSTFQIHFKSNKNLDTQKLVILQNGKIIEGAFKKVGNTYSANIKLRSRSPRVVLGWLKTPKRVEPVVEYKL